ncbi:zinc-binding dehydrogenase [Mesorhizobium sp. B2-3-11]|uniref:zinc-binding dehydrogenase n=1 Tax=Mesorhizobium sp. B2-3-11 TaxID=2589953 RepID=UPI0015E37883|nr:zinc-binding dehydrogenase [Mesorhizobium sp. B2-3-11]
MCAFIGYGGAQELVAADASMVVPIPSGVSDEQAAGVIIAHGTVLHSLRQRAALKPGETLVVSGATGGVGLAGIEIAKRLGARVIACASGDAKMSQLRHLGVDVVLDFETDDLKKRIKAATGGKGADVVLDLTGGPKTESLLRATSWGGRYIVVGFASGKVVIHMNDSNSAYHSDL